ncbi:uncharacterized mitochondrial protein AtMg00810-like [Miscanthus floridulus]|uniref:uncharacterized mitochondrial protein AtMg00810-like n=1 Tax=Miscanthus floridulus TaxID=154761 RepID=UPI00345ADB52
MEERLKLSKHTTAVKVDMTRYWSIIDGLRYLTHTRPDIVFAVRGCSIKRSSSPRVAARVGYGLRSLVRHTKAKEGEPELTVFSDGDMAGDIDGRRSTFGVLVFFGVAPIAWRSLKQKIMALSTCEVEYVAVAMAAC